jgi:hypothetical protein
LDKLYAKIRELVQLPLVVK